MEKKQKKNKEKIETKQQYASYKKERKGKEKNFIFLVNSSSAEAVVWGIVNWN